MDHKLIDQALKQLLSTKAVERTAEQIQGFAHLVCSAAGVTADAPPSTLSSLPELHAAVLLLANQLDVVSLNPNSTVTTEFRLSNRAVPKIAVYIHNPHGFDSGKTILSGYGNSPEEVLRALRDNAYDLCKLGADAYDLSSLEAK
ncbi:hypothetical protein SAMN04490186_5903 [Pseudomonas grimontii]|uniref:Uncharacterized protein n=1 Tax=Pseudomonas grimontii TaxID=129847 RepID=A0A1H1IM33_9PSED|nr:hypothetical protein [Pseudomonas grimontii]TWR70546.1 hypothetical protein FIV39_04190 [Pseudomonas grimontii]SDR38767.1 hypothetical protein SAMN04490186_5903 [Pseudomonas grimontii]